MTLKDQLGDRLASARNAARSGQYQLLLGAGASIGARGPSGLLPDGKGLVKALADKYPDARIKVDSRITRAYQRAVLSASPDDVWWFLRSIFFGATHQSWFSDLASLPWRRVWTLNVDDAFEQAYRKSVRQPFAGLKVIDWVDQYFEPVGPEIIHLHGQVAGKSPSPIVFSVSEYHGAAEAQGVWHKVLRGVLASEPVVVVGAGILDDLDVETLILAAKPRSHAPSIIVDPFISDDNAWELSKAGYLVIKNSGDSWLEDWVELFGLDNDNLDSLYQSAAVNLPQIEELIADRMVPAPASHDFFGGSEPLWSDACQGFIAPFEWISQISTHVLAWAGAASDSIFVRVVYVQRLAGGTAGLLGVAQRVRANGVRVLRFDRSVRFSPQRVLDMCRGSGPVLLLIDGGYAFADDVNTLAQLAHDVGNARLYILVGERPQRAGIVEDHLTDATYAVEVEHIPLRRSMTDARQVERILRQQGRLDQLEGLSLQSRIKHFHKRDIFSAMSEVEHAAGFRARLEIEISQLSTRWHRELVVLLALASEGGVQVSLIEASFALDTAVDSILSAVNGEDHLGALAEVDGELLLARHRLHAVDALVSSGGGKDFLNSLSVMLDRLAELIPHGGYASRTRGSSLVRHLMSAKMLRRIFPNADVDTLYQRILGSYGDWNARYWEQRSIYARITGEWDPAVSFAERAVSVHDDSFTRNTLAVNLLHKATYLASVDDPAWRDYYDKGLEEFETSFRRERSIAVSLWARLDSVLDLIDALANRAKRGNLRESIQDVLDNWATSYSEYRVSLPRILGSESVNDAEKLSERYSSLEELITQNSVSGGAPDSDEFSKSSVRAVIVSEIDQLRLPTSLGKIASEVRQKLTVGLQSNWGGYRTFKRALMDAVPDVVIRPENAGTIWPKESTTENAAKVAADDDDFDSIELLKVIRQLVENLETPTTMAALASQVSKERKLTAKHDWGGHNTFKKALLHAVPDVQLDPAAPGYVIPSQEDVGRAFD